MAPRSSRPPTRSMRRSRAAHRPGDVATAARGSTAARRRAPLTLAQAINARWPTRLELPRAAGLRRGRGGQGRRLRRHPGLHERAGAGRVFDTVLDEQSILGLALGAAVTGFCRSRDPVPRLPAQRRGPAARRGGDAAVLLPGPVPQPHGRADRRLRLPEGLRRPLPQRRRRRRAPRHPRPRGRLAGPAGRRGGDAADVRRRGRQSTAASACSSSRSRSTTRAICTRPATGWLARPPPAERARADRLGPHLRRRPRPDHRDVRQRAT